MSYRLLLILTALAVTLSAQNSRPTDIDPASFSRFPIVQRGDLKTDADRAVYDSVVGTDRKSVV